MKRIPLVLFLALCCAPLLFAQSNEDCMECHGDKDCTGFTKDGTEISMFLDIEKFEKSIHGDLDCTDCHGGIDDLPHADDLPPVDCGFCHEDEQKEYAGSAHGLALKRKGPAPAMCRDCHGRHDILACDDPAARTRPSNIANLCGSCHARPEVIRLFGGRGNDPVALWEKSVHGRSMRADSGNGAATCTNCHGSHKIFRKTDLRSMDADPNIPATCGKCHEKEKAEYEQSAHWHALRRGFYESPVCNDCHGGHAVESPAKLRDYSDRENRLSELCRGCHSSKILMERFGLDAKRFESYMKTYHALATLQGSKKAADCTSCHETHAIRGQDDPESSINAKNLVGTCGRCHEKATENFVHISIHPIDRKDRNPAAYWIGRAYVYLIVLVIGGMILHNMVILFYFIRGKYRSEKKAASYQRFRRFEVYQHGLLVLSFASLAVTGFALKFPDSFWVRWLAGIGMTEAVRSTVHRGAAVVMVASSVLQMIYLAGTRSGRRDLLALRPTIEDMKQFFQNMKYHLRLSRRKPAFPRFDYTEKMEYLALIWGIVVMACTGFILWFPEFFARFLPWWAFEIAEVVHFFEAILATLAILFWHWFFVLYHPEIYPMKLSWMSGRVTEAELKEHHPLEYAEMKAAFRKREASRTGGGDGKEAATKQRGSDGEPSGDRVEG